MATGFNISSRIGNPDPKFWSSESGFARNEELQWYQSRNAACKNGVLRIEGRKERVRNPNYSAGSSSWKTNRQYAEYTSSSITTSGRKTWQFGRVEVRARLDAQMGSWPAIWTLGTRGEWPTNGEVDIMEFYPSGTTPLFQANLAWGTATRWNAAWNSKTRTLSNVRVYQTGSSSIAERLAAKDWRIAAIPGTPGQFLLTQSVDPDARWEIRSATGRLVLERRAEDGIRIDLGREPSGVYIARLRTRAGDAVSKLLR